MNFGTYFCKELLAQNGESYPRWVISHSTGPATKIRQVISLDGSFWIISSLHVRSLETHMKGFVLLTSPCFSWNKNHQKKFTWSTRSTENWSMHTKKVATAVHSSKMVAYAHQHFVVSPKKRKKKGKIVGMNKRYLVWRNGICNRRYW